MKVLFNFDFTLSVSNWLYFLLVVDGWVEHAQSSSICHKYACLIHNTCTCKVNMCLSIQHSSKVFKDQTLIAEVLNA